MYETGFFPLMVHWLDEKPFMRSIPLVAGELIFFLSSEVALVACFSLFVLKLYSVKEPCADQLSVNC